jgi:hypothetical protein
MPHDIQVAFEYYNSRFLKLGFRFSDEVNNSLEAI